MTGEDQKRIEKPLEIVCRIAPKRAEQEICVIPVDYKHVKLVPPKTYIPRNNEPFVSFYFLYFSPEMLLVFHYLHFLD